jgi:sporulation protein YlmC with PRC-barrel domain
MMRAELRRTALIGILFAVLGYSQDSSSILKAKIDAVVSAAYKSASMEFPCTLKAQGIAKMLSWQAVEKCLNNANDRVNWEELTLQIQEVRKERRFKDTEIYSAIESSLSVQAIPYSKVFKVKDADALLPLSSSLLKFLPIDSLLALPVYNNSGVRIGTFSGVYVFEKVGAISGNKLKHSLFQYTDPAGRINNPSDQLLLDSYGIRWKQAESQRGFRLSSDKLIPKH